MEDSGGGYILLTLGLALVLRFIVECRRHRRARRNREAMRHITGAPAWWGRR